MPRDAVSRTANVERTGRHKWVNNSLNMSSPIKYQCKLICHFRYFVVKYFNVFYILDLIELRHKIEIIKLIIAKEHISRRYFIRKIAVATIAKIPAEEEVCQFTRI